MSAIMTRRASRAENRFDVAVYALLAAAGLLLAWLSAARPSSLPFWAPWDFSWPPYLAAGLASLWFLRGLTTESLMRKISFFAGLVLIYGVVQTRYEYMAEHMFVLNRIQHVVMHHLGPMLIVLAWPGAALKRGMPQPVRRLVEHRALVRCIRFAQLPAPAAILFVGLIFFWLIPAIHFRAMIDRNLYWVMNWSMIVDGLLFWSLVLDPRPSPPARASFATRGALALAVVFPQIAGGAAIAFGRADLYPYYNLCGRLFPTVSALADQQLGGLVIWIPPAMMSVFALLLVFDRFRRDEDRRSLLSANL